MSRLTEAPTSNYFQELYPGTHIHAGFLEQFQEVVSNTVSTRCSCMAWQPFLGDSMLSQNAPQIGKLGSHLPCLASLVLHQVGVEVGRMPSGGKCAGGCSQ